MQDSPDNPCPCIDIILWLPTFPTSVKKTTKKNDEGLPIYDFTLARDAVVYVDLQMPIRPTELERVARVVRKRRAGLVIENDSNGRRPPKGGAEDGPVATAKVDKGWLGFGFGVGWAVGGLLDDLAGSNEGGNDNLSDDLSDWAADNFPAPDWLQDIF